MPESSHGNSPKPERPQTVAERRFAEAAAELTRLDLATRFARMYETNLWDDAESRSGTGSSLAATAQVRAGLPALFRQLGVRRLLDVPCGDFHWMAHVDLAAAGVETYVGGDLVEAVVAANTARYATADRSFVRVDLTTWATSGGRRRCRGCGALPRLPGSPVVREHCACVRRAAAERGAVSDHDNVPRAHGEC